MSAVWKENMILYVLTDLMIKTYKVWRYRLNYVLSKYTQMTRTSPYVGSSHANIQLKNTTTTALHTACLALASSDCTMKPKYFWTSCIFNNFTKKLLDIRHEVVGMRIFTLWNDSTGLKQTPRNCVWPRQKCRKIVTRFCF